MTTGSAAALALSVDELRAVARLTGLLLPSLLLDDDDLDAGVRDVVAVRGLLARGLVWLAGPAASPALTAPLAALLAPLTRPSAVAELELEAAGTVLRTAAADGPGGLVVLSEREPDVWLLAPWAGEFAEVLLALLEDGAGGDGGSCAVARRTGTTYVLEQVDWAAGEDPTPAVLSLLGVAA